MYDVLIIGCGIIGSAAAYELSKYHLSVGILEKYNDVANGATKANSAILHAGFDPHPGTAMARLNTLGIKMAKEICEKLDVERREIPSFVLAFSEEEMATVRDLYARGTANGVNVKILTGDEVRELEPEISGEVVGALWSPDSAVVDPWGYAIAMAEVAVRNGVTLHRNQTVRAIRREGEISRVTTDNEVYTAKYIINAAGASAPDINAMVGDTTLKAQNLCGQYYVLDKSEGKRVNSVIFCCPNKNGKGVLVSPTVHGNLIVGPDAFVVDDPECVGTDPITLPELKEKGHRSVPGVNFREMIHEYAGVRPNTQFDDFYIKELPECPGFIALAGIKSPGLSAAPAIALEAVELLRAAGLTLTPNENFVDGRRVVRFRSMSDEQRRELIARNPLYGRIICRCETVTEGEIVDAIHRPIVPMSVDAIKRRCNAGMGRCQGGFCGPRVHEILARELGLDPIDIMMDEKNTFILTGRTKEGKTE
ncbi:MAG: NAD(P)/FAD-dependent oxidoreductase [Clostridia bacterium]|nr:NAD(P)/FAD-dependent oxidoreductase [Clostridia bacterium]